MKGFIGILSFVLCSLLAMPALAVASPQGVPLRLVMSVGAPLTSTAFVQMLGSSPKGIAGVSVVNTSVRDIEVAFGAMGQESVQLIAPASSATGAVPLVTPLTGGYGTRVSVIALDSAAYTGEVQLNLFLN